MPRGGLRLGFACAWDPDPRATWSQTPWNLREALRDHVEIVDVGVQVPRAVRLGLRALHARRVDGRMVSAWKHSASWEAICHRVVEKRARRHAVDAVLEMQDLAAVERPFFLYQDASYDVLLHTWDWARGPSPHFPMLDRTNVERRRARQHDIYRRATGVLAMSRWFATTLVTWSGVDAERVHVVHPGINASGPGEPIPDRTQRRRRRLLLVGRDFHTKAGELVVAALARLRRDHDPALELTVAGPRTWPLSGGIPDGVRFLGPTTTADVAALYDEHDVFVMPSRFEGFGIAFAEALARGLPCVGRDAFAMPEMIVPGHNGALVRDDDIDRLAGAIVGVIDDDALYVRCREDAAGVASHFSWARAAEDVLHAVHGGTGFENVLAWAPGTASAPVPGMTPQARTRPTSQLEPQCP